jgi:hypothetical protein
MFWRLPVSVLKWEDRSKCSTFPKSFCVTFCKCQWYFGNNFICLNNLAPTATLNCKYKMSWILITIWETAELHSNAIQHVPPYQWCQLLHKNNSAFIYQISYTGSQESSTDHKVWTLQHITLNFVLKSVSESGLGFHKDRSPPSPPVKSNLLCK